MAEAAGGAGIVQAVVEITRKATGETETYVIEGKVTHEEQDDDE